MRPTYLLLGLLLLGCARSAKILGVFHNPSRSHFMLGNALMEGLAANGHDVTMLAPYKYNSSFKNYNGIEVKGLQLAKDAVIEKVRTVIDASIPEKVFSLIDNYHTVNELFLNHSTVKNLLASKVEFDVVIVDWVFNDAFLGIAHHFNAHSIILSSFKSSFLINKITSNPAPSSYVPELIPAYPDTMTFLQRTVNFIKDGFLNAVEYAYIRPSSDLFLHRYFPNAPHLTDLLHNTSLVLINSHFTTESPRPFVPNMIHVGGLHIKEPKPLQGELKVFMDNATEGVVYCSFGSIIKSAEMTSEKINSIIKAFSKLNVQVLWKFESDDIPELPPNVRTAKWFPQSDLLAHPNLKGFISHGGLLSTMEALYNGVPTIVSPFMADQESNAEHVINKGYAIGLKFHEMNEETLSKAVKELVDNPKYRQNAKELSRIFKDRPLHPLATAVYWVEYVISHNGAHHLKTAALKLNWYQYFLFDVMAFILAVLASVIAVLWILIKCLLKPLRKLKLASKED